MTNAIGKNGPDRLMAYLDGDLSPADTLAFEAAVAADPALAAELDRHREVERSLRALHAPAQTPPDPRDFTPPAIPISPRPSARLIGLAAMLLLTMGGVFAWLQYSAFAARPVASAIYAEALQVRFTPEYVCEDAAAFEAYTDEAYGRAIAADFESGVELVGWRYPGHPGYTPADHADVQGPRVLLARAPGGEGIVVIFQPRSTWAPSLAGLEGLRSFERIIGPVRVIEVTPLDRPVVLGLLAERR